MLLKDSLKELFNKASLDENVLLKENIIIKWVHRFGFDSLNELINQKLSKGEKKHYKEEKDEQISLIQGEYKEEKQHHDNYKFIANSNNLEKQGCKSNKEKTFKDSEKKNKNNIPFLKTNIDTTANKSPLPDIKNLRKWINNSKKAS